MVRHVERRAEVSEDLNEEVGDGDGDVERDIGRARFRLTEQLGRSLHLLLASQLVQCPGGCQGE
jgi:hypothetical protein